MTNNFSVMLIQTLCYLVVIVCSGFIIPTLKKWVENRIGADKLKQLEAFTEFAVRGAEQIYSPEEWQDKKLYVFNYITNKASLLGLELTEQDINNIVEGCVNLIKKG